MKIFHDLLSLSFTKIFVCLDPSMPLIQKLDTGDVTTCKAIGHVANIPGMDKWCTDNCPTNCPDTYCSCMSLLPT